MSKLLIDEINTLVAGDWVKLQTILLMLAGEPNSKEAPSQSESPSPSKT